MPVRGCSRGTAEGQSIHDFVRAVPALNEHRFFGKAAQDAEYIAGKISETITRTDPFRNNEAPAVAERKAMRSERGLALERMIDVHRESGAVAIVAAPVR